jgi:hypothetical protein
MSLSASGEINNSISLYRNRYMGENICSTFMPSKGVKPTDKEKPPMLMNRERA